MKLFLKYFLLFVPTFLASIVSNEIRTVGTRTETLPYGLLYVKPTYNFKLLVIGLFFPIIFLIQGYYEHGVSLLLIKYSIVFLTFLSGFWIISNDIILFEIKKAAKIFFWIFFLLSIIQYTNILAVYDDIFSYFFSKGRLGTGQSYRGASLLYSEVARASFYILFIYIIAYGYKIKTNTVIPFLVLILMELVLIKSTTGYFLIFILIFLNFPIVTISILALSYFFFITLQVIQLPEFNQYKIDYILQTINNGNLNLLETIMTMDGERVTGIIFTIKTIFNHPFGYLYASDVFEPVSGRIAVSAPLLFIRTFGIFAIIYLYMFIKSTGIGSYKSFFYILILASAYSPNSSPLVLLAATIEYKMNSNIKRIK